jgi:hypothetical protein
MDNGDRPTDWFLQYLIYDAARRFDPAHWIEVQKSVELIDVSNVKDLDKNREG